MSKNQRRKGNAQTASSSRAAELLQSSGIPLQALLGLDTSSVDIPDAFADEFGPNVDPEFRIALKKLSKRDSFTREKAVKELADLLNNSNYEQTKNSFSAFASSYSKLLTIMPFLLISLSDNYGQVSRSAEAVLNDCFTEEKRQLVMKNFAPQSIEIALAFLNKSHKLTQPQKFVEEETDVQRQNRLIAQALVSIQRLVDENSQLGQDLYEQFSKAALLTALMNMGVNVKTAVFALLKKLLEKNSEPFLSTRIPSVVLSHLDSSDIAICRNAFECFLILAAQEKFYETCKIDKAVVPKFVSLIRKKALHWKVLETSLLPSVALIFEHLPENSREKWLNSVIESLFDGNLEDISISSWTTVFIEVSKFCFLNTQGNESFISQLLTKVHKFIEISTKIKDESIVKQSVSLPVWIFVRNSQNESRFLPNFMLNTFKKEFTENLLNKLPESTPFAREFIEQHPDPALISSILRSSSTPNTLFIDSLNRLQAEEIMKLNEKTDLSDLFRLRILQEGNPETRSKLLNTLCNLLEKNLIDSKLESIVDVENLEICAILVPICADLPDLLPMNTRVSIVKRLGRAIRNESIDESLWTPLILWILRFENDCIEEVVRELFSNDTDLGLLLKLVGKLLTENKINDQLELLLSGTIFHGLLHDCLENEPHEENLLTEAFAISQQLRVNINEVQAITQRCILQLNSVADVKKVAQVIKKLKFANFDASLFAPSKDELLKAAKTMDQKFSSFILSKHHLIACYASMPKISLQLSEELLTLSYLARHALFLRYLDRLDSNVVLYVDFIGCLSNSILSDSFIYERYGVPSDIIEELNRRDFTDLQLFEAFINVFNYSTESAPLCILLALWYRLIKADEKDNNFLIQLAPDLVGNVSQISSLLFTAGINRSFQSNTEKSLVQLIEDFEFSSFRFNAENRAEVFVLMADFVEKEKARFEDWLFMLQKTNEGNVDELRNALSCAVLRLCAQIVPYLLELEGPLRDFINCGFITALQSCTEVLESPVENRADSVFVELTAYLCLRLFKNYGTCIQLNLNETNYADIVQEWQEFFGPASINYILRWFTNVGRNVNLPDFCLKAMCSAIHSMNCEMLVRADVLGIPQANPFIDSIEEWEKYPTKLISLLKPAASLILNEHPEVQFSAAKILKCAALDMFKFENSTIVLALSSDSENIDEENLPNKEENKKLPALFQRILIQAEDLTASLSESEERGGLIENEKSGVCPVFLVWDVLLQFLAELDVLTRVDYCSALESNVVHNVMTFLFTKLSDPPIPEHGQTTDELFTEKINFAEPKSFSYSHYLCNLYYRTLITIPALVRQWYNSLPRSLSGIVHRYTKNYVSGPVLRREMMNAGNKVKMGRLSIKVLPKINEITAGYKLEDTTMSLNISLPADYPLALPSVNNERAIVSRDIQRRWLLQLTLFLAHQNGSMMDGILQWKRNIDQHLEGVEDCTICMMSVSTTNYQLPKIRCKQLQMVRDKQQLIVSVMPVDFLLN
uniref:E3 ubiquitin-protein ligase listerin n=1 Tax=Acrobeloides nanus TaxID=290746 RepID=A0A914DQJ4_9BILA